jgi:general secretion pathway protein H
VLGILALVFSAFATSYRRPATSWEPKALALRIAAELRAVRATAIRRSREMGLTLNAEERWYQVEGFQRVFLPRSMDLVLLTARPYVRGKDDARLVFFRDGSSTGGKLTLTSGDRAHAVAVDWLTGAVRIEDPAREVARPQ